MEENKNRIIRMYKSCLEEFKLNLNLLLFFYLVFLASESISILTAAEIPQSYSSKGSVRYLEGSSFLSSRALMLSGSLSTYADGIEATSHNPANIGDSFNKNKNKNYVKFFYFPYLGVALSPNASSNKGENGLGSNEGLNSMLSSNNGEHSYARSSAVFALGVGRFIFVQSNDLQLSLSRLEEKADDGENYGVIQKHQNIGVGYSFTDTSKKIALGFYTAYSTLNVFNGNYNSSEVTDFVDTQKLLTDNSVGYSGVSTNVGLRMNLDKGSKPSFALVIKNLGGSSFSGSGPKGNSRSKALAKSYKVDQNITLGLSISPRLKKFGLLRISMEASRLNQNELSLAKKMSLGAELVTYGFGRSVEFYLRAGYDGLGGSLGLGANSGFFRFDIGVADRDIGSLNNHVIERVYLAVLSVNISNPS